MKIGEDVKISLRSIQKRPVESILLVLGIALGIGATAAGISLISHSVTAKEELLAKTQYKELIVRVRESAEDMDLSAMPKVGEGSVILSWQDLVAQNDVPDIEYAYLANPQEIRVGNFGNAFAAIAGGAGAGGGTIEVFRGQAPPGGGPGGGQPGEGVVIIEGDLPKGAIVIEGEEGSIVMEDLQAPPDGEEGQSGDRQPRGFEGFNFEDIPVPAGPEPVIDEFRGMRVSPEYFSAWNLNASAGSLFTQTEMEENKPVIVLGSNLGVTIFEDGESLGRELLIFRSLVEIIGILEPTGTEQDDMGFVPAPAPNIERIPEFARQFIGLNTTLHYTVYDPTRLDEAKSQLGEWFTQKYGEGQVVISIPRAEVEAAQDRTSRLVSVILFLAVAGLLIASVNVSNILLGRALRKRKNVGILKALGASIRDVFGLFFIEALVLGVSGAIVGTGISILI
ncbi:MAG: FtsX-like permease family protein, partial [Spirochaetales bacterium]|nr:FtsX-like permease family protein [Spirochaetales bacterium]